MNFLRTNYGEILLDEDILYFTYFPITNFDINLAEAIVSDRLHLQKDQAYPVLCDMSNINYPNLEARRYLATQGSLLIKAVAYLVSSKISAQLTNFFIRVNHPPIPTKVFTDKEQAITYLKLFK
ncbi:hypothetical protein GGR32_002225 [Mesonia hippocampi]|uniref:DUF7793 domain-containing protein n=1 Tax=Mesonia hippocampi TaxID=1628250 RepID=A0A840ETR5_9FLAO|nr:hypothetical protein [Mesonia hippocampi]MBB4119913.1 hypothetical protein [Mesonia hippocampi]